ncbi:MAG: cytochrome c3 family protein [candidate division WOR-3 bacterium]
MSKFFQIFYAFYLLIFAIIFIFYMSIIEKRENSPIQPIKFSHKIHAYKLSLDCVFCHEKVEESTFTLPPPLSLCMTCHESVKKDSPEIIKLTTYYNKGEAVPWVKVHKFKDWVYFSHKRHIKKGIDCTFCHGEIKAMDVVRKVRSMRMGFCVKCHEINGAERDCSVCHK